MMPRVVVVVVGVGRRRLFARPWTVSELEVSLQLLRQYPRQPSCRFCSGLQTTLLQWPTTTTTTTTTTHRQQHLCFSASNSAATNSGRNSKHKKRRRPKTADTQTTTLPKDGDAARRKPLKKKKKKKKPPQPQTLRQRLRRVVEYNKLERSSSAAPTPAQWLGEQLGASQALGVTQRQRRRLRRGAPSLLETATSRAHWVRERVFQLWNPDYRVAADGTPMLGDRLAHLQHEKQQHKLVMDERWWFWNILWAMTPGFLVMFVCEVWLKADFLQSEALRVQHQLQQLVEQGYLDPEQAEAEYQDLVRQQIEHYSLPLPQRLWLFVQTDVPRLLWGATPTEEELQAALPGGGAAALPGGGGALPAGVSAAPQDATTSDSSEEQQQPALQATSEPPPTDANTLAIPPSAAADQTAYPAPAPPAEGSNNNNNNVVNNNDAALLWQRLEALEQRVSRAEFHRQKRMEHDKRQMQEQSGVANRRDNAIRRDFIKSADARQRQSPQTDTALPRSTQHFSLPGMPPAPPASQDASSSVPVMTASELSQAMWDALSKQVDQMQTSIWAPAQPKEDRGDNNETEVEPAAKASHGAHLPSLTEKLRQTAHVFAGHGHNDAKSPEPERTEPDNKKKANDSAHSPHRSLPSLSEKLDKTASVFASHGHEHHHHHQSAAATANPAAARPQGWMERVTTWVKGEGVHEAEQEAPLLPPPPPPRVDKKETTTTPTVKDENRAKPLSTTTTTTTTTHRPGSGSDKGDDSHKSKDPSSSRSSNSNNNNGNDDTQEVTLQEKKNKPWWKVW